MISKVIHINDSYNDGQDISCTLIEKSVEKRIFNKNSLEGNQPISYSATNVHGEKKIYKNVKYAINIPKMISYFIFERFACTPREKTSQFAVSVTICGNSLLEMGNDTIIFQRKSARAHFLNFFVRFTYYLSLTKKPPKKQ